MSPPGDLPALRGVPGDVEQHHAGVSGALQQPRLAHPGPQRGGAEWSVNTRAVPGIEIEVSDQATVTHQRLGGEVAGRAGAVVDQMRRTFPGLHRRLNRPADQAPRRISGGQHRHSDADSTKN